MAASFKALRQYEKVGLIILGVVVMVVFTVDLNMFFGGNNSDPTIQAKGANVVSWKNGKLNQGQVEELINDNQQITAVQDEIKRIISKDKANPAQSKVEEIFRVNSPGDVIQRYIYFTHATAMGIQVDDQTVKEFLVKLSGERLNNREIKGILDEVVGDTPEARNRLFAAMRRELAAKMVERMLYSGMSGIAPEAAWQQFKKSSQQAQIEFIAHRAADFVDKVTEKPSEGELKKLYDELKTKARFVDTPDSGVIRTEEVAFAWVKGDFEKYVQEEMKKISDEKVAEYYEKNKTSFRQTQKPPPTPPASTDEKKSDGAEQGEDPSKEDPNKEDPAKETEPSKTEPSTIEPANTDPATPEKPKEEPRQPTDPPIVEEPKSQDPPADPKDGEEESLVALIQEPSTPPASQDPPAKEPAPTQESANEKTQEPAADPEKKEAAPEGEQGAGDKTNPPAETGVQEAPAGPPPPQEEFRPLSEVADMIRRDLAAPAADKRYNEALTAAEAELRALWKKVNLGEGKIDEAALKKFDFEAFAEKYGFTSGAIPLGPFDVVIKKEGLGNFPGFAYQAFTEKSMLYEPQTIRNRNFSSLETYIYWRTENKAEFTPTFEECREDLEKAYRYRKAKELAEAAAKKMAAEVKAGKSLKEHFPKEKVLVTGDFSYMNQFTRQVGGIPEIPLADEPFMDGIFNLKPMTATALPLANKSEFYVVYLSKYRFTDQELRERFANIPQFAEFAYGAMMNNYKVAETAQKEFFDSLNVRFANQEPEEVIEE
jgi:hypothetical protein